MSFIDLFKKMYDVFNDDKGLEYHALQIFVRSDDYHGYLLPVRSLPGELYVPKSALENLPFELKDYYC
jgi:hypothetical protein